MTSLNQQYKHTSTHYVKPPDSSIISATLNSMIHHKVFPLPNRIILSKNFSDNSKPYGVSRTYRILSPELLLKKFDNIRDMLTDTLGFTIAQREVTLRLLRFWAYYGYVYPKESTITLNPGCSKATFWRTIALLKEKRLIQVINRFVIRPHAQISNLYRLDRLLVLLARYLAEHSVHFLEKWLAPALSMPGSSFWPGFWALANGKSPP